MSVNFEKYLGDANLLLNMVEDELQVDNRDQAARIFRAVLHALRDRVPVDLACNFASQLPMIWKGIFFDQYNPASTPVRIRDAEDWIEFIRTKDAFAVMADFPTDVHVLSAFSCCIRALDEFMAPGSVDKVLNALPHEILEMVDLEPVAVY